VIPARLNMMARKISNDTFMEMQREQFRSMSQPMVAESELSAHTEN
jgi:hypothetical protein